MIVATLFGTTDGLEVQNLPVGPAMNIKLEDGIVAFSSKDVKLKSDGDIFRIFRRNVDGQFLTWIGLYREATEIVSNRPGGHYGAGLWLYGSAVPGQLVVETLVNLADQIKNLAILNGKLTKRIAEIRGLIVPPPQLAQLLANKKPIVTGISPSGSSNALISNQVISAAGTLEWAQISHSAELFNELLIGHPDQFQPQQGQFQKTIERFESVATAVQWAYNKRVVQLDGLLNQEREKVASASQQLMKATTDQDDIKQQLSLSEHKLKDAWEAQKRMQQQYDAELQRMQAQVRGMPPQAPVHRPVMSTSPQGQQTAALARQVQRGFFAQNWPFLGLILVLMLSLGGVGYMLHSAKADASDQAKELEDKKLALQQLEVAKTEADAALKRRSEELEELKKKGEPKKTEVKDAGQKETRLIPDASESKCQPVADGFIRYSYVIGEDGKKSLRSDLYKAIEKDCKLDQLRAVCGTTITNRIKVPFESEINQLKGEILLPKNCNAGKQLQMTRLGLTLTPIKEPVNIIERSSDKPAEKNTNANTD